MEDSLPVTLIVKAPNQQVADQTIQCEPSWTIRKLKGHLSEVYPCRPKSEEQKLIYSGKLLPDTVVLKDVLRKYEGQDTHTVHLVCTPLQLKYGKTTIKNTQSTDHDVHNNSTNNSQNNSNPNNSDGLRHRNVNETSSVYNPQNSNSNASSIPNCFPFNSFINQEHLTAWNSQYNQWFSSTFNSSPQNTVDYAQIFSNMQTPSNVDPQTFFAAHLAWMEQYRLQQMQHYYNMTGVVMPNIFPANLQIPNDQIINNETTRENHEAPRREEPANVNDNGGEGENRDWLDWIYNVSRWILMFSIVYFYSSPMRFLIVLILGTVLYVFQLWPHNDAPNEQHRNINNNYQQPRVINEQPQNNAETGENNVNDENIQIVNNDVALNENSALSFIWTAVTSFFASLIPEVPNGRN